MGKDTADDNALPCQLVTVEREFVVGEGQLQSVAPQAFYELKVLLVGKPSLHALCDDQSDAVHFQQLLEGSLTQGIHAAEIAGQ